MIFKYRAKKGPDGVIEGTIEAKTKEEAIEKVSSMGYLPMLMEEHRPAPGTAPAGAAKRFGGKVKGRDITVFSRQLASLLKAGVPILASLNIIAEQSESQHLSGVLRKIHNAVKDGSTLSASLAEYPAVFSPLYIAMVRAGESTGVLPEVLFRIADYRGKQEELFSRFRMALAYPILMALVGTGTIIFMLTFVMPRLTKIFITLEQALPLPTLILISVSSALSNLWFWVILLALVLIVKREARTPAARKVLGRLLLRLPLFGKLTLKIELSRFARTLELLLKSGIPILKAIDVAVPVVGNEAIREQLKASHKELEQGGSFGKSLKSSKLFPAFMTSLITVGEESGKLTDSLAEVVLSYERDADEAIKIMTNLLEPLMILVMGLIVGFLVVAMLLPIFEINIMVR